jgi:hypothetical protein
MIALQAHPNDTTLVVMVASGTSIQNLLPTKFLIHDL